MDDVGRRGGARRPWFGQQFGLQNTGQLVNGTTGTPGADIDAPEAWDLGVRIEIFVTAPRTYGKYTRFVIRSGRPPARIDRCVLNKTAKPIACPAG
jgi:hypothetical protein